MLSREEHRKQRADEIFAVASQVLCKMGYEKASIRDIAEATQMTKAGLYYYFRSKEELLFKILDSYMDSLISGITILSNSLMDPEDRIKKFINFHINFYSSNLDRSKIVIQDVHCLSAEWRNIIKDKELRYVDFWRSALQKYLTHNNIEIDHLSAQVMILLGMCNWTYKWYDPKGSMPPDELADLIFKRFFHGLNS